MINFKSFLQINPLLVQGGARCHHQCRVIHGAADGSSQARGGGAVDNPCSWRRPLLVPPITACASSSFPPAVSLEQLKLLVIFS